MADAPAAASPPGREEQVAAVRARTDAIRTASRDNAKWVIGSFGAIVAFAVGGSNLSQIGSLEWGPRLFLAVGSLAGGALLCWKPVVDAIGVVLTGLSGYEEVFNAPRFAKARAAAEREFLSQFGPGVRTFDALARAFRDSLSHFAACKKAVEDAADAPGRDAAKQALAEAQANMDQLWINVSVATEFTTAKAKALDFENLLGDLRFYGAGAVIAFAVFAWAANPAKPEGALSAIGKPKVVEFKWDDAALATLDKANLDDICRKNGPPKLVPISELSGLRQDVLAIPSTLNADCPPVRLILTRDGRLANPG